MKLFLLCITLLLWICGILFKPRRLKADASSSEAEEWHQHGI